MRTKGNEVWAMPLVLHARPALDMNKEQFLAFCRQNPELRIEQTAEGDIEIMSSTGGETGFFNFRLVVELGRWAERNNAGEGFDSSTGFILPNGATRSPDVSWVRREQLSALSDEEKKSLLPLCPDFAAEIRSSSDNLRPLQNKMQEYIANGTQLAWLVDPSARRVYVFRPDREMETLENPETVSGDPELPGFVFNAQRFFDRRL
jgi:Uma2 family endonuclease